jgi:uncharacterized membrane protein YhaH (DUF805 family)
MAIKEAISYCFRHYVGFNGRAARSEYWYWTLFVYLLLIVCWLIDMTVFGFNTTGVNPMTVLALLAILLPTLGVSARRLHDIDRSGWWALLIFTVIGYVVLIYWACMRGTVGANRFGPDPLEGKV